MHAAERTQVRVNVALNLIDQADSPLKVRFAVAYAIGYIDALTDERLISLDGAGCTGKTRLSCAGPGWRCSA